MSTFREQYPEFARLVKELILLREHNRRPLIRQDHQFFLFAEGALVLIALERFLRMILQGEATDKDTLPNLLEKATSERLDLFQFTPPESREQSIREIKDVRNTILHGNYEQAARQTGCATTEEYFSTQFPSELEALFKLGDEIVKHIDPESGKPRSRATK